MLNFSAIPLLDLQQFFSAEKNVRDKFVNQLRAICHQVGFFYVINHGIDVLMMKRILFLAKAFFDLPEKEKEAISIRHSRHFRGYGKLGAEVTLGVPDYKETYDLGLEHVAKEICQNKPYLTLHGPNQWPSSSVLKTLHCRESVMHFIAEMQQLGETLMKAMALALLLPENYFAGQFGADTEDAYAILRLLRYPPGDKNQQLGVGPHTDFGCLAFLLQDEVGGLQVQNCDGKWIDAPPMPGTFVVNIGDMLQIWSNNYFLATPHRVINTTTKTRYSAPFFYEPNLSTEVTPIDLSPYLSPNINRPRLDKNKKVVYGEHMWEVYKRSFPDYTSSLRGRRAF